MITAKDRLVLNHIEEFKMITADQARMLTYPLIASGYQSARKRLHRLLAIENRLKVIRNEELGINVYVNIDMDIRKVPNSPHRIYLLNFYCKLKSMGAEIIAFIVEKEWMRDEKNPNGKYRSDALLIYKYDNTLYFNLIEVNKSNNALNLGRFDEAKDEIIERFSGHIPTIILIDSRGHKAYNSKVFQVIKVDYKLTNFHSIFKV